MQTGETVSTWRHQLQEKLNESSGLRKTYPKFDPHHPSKYSGYVYDAVWLYALGMILILTLSKRQKISPWG